MTYQKTQMTLISLLVIGMFLMGSAKSKMLLAIGVLFFCASAAFAQYQMEDLSRGVVAVRTGSAQVYVGWRLLGTEATANIGFNVYRINFSPNGGFVQFNNVDGGASGATTMRIRYALGVTSSRTGQLTVNGVAQNITFNPTGSWTTWAVMIVNVNLAPGGGNQIIFQSTGQDLANIDQIQFP